MVRRDLRLSLRRRCTCNIKYFFDPVAALEVESIIYVYTVRRADDAQTLWRGLSGEVRGWSC